MFHRSALQLLQFCQEHHRNRFKNEIHSIEDALIEKVLADDVSNDGKELDLDAFTLIEQINDVQARSKSLSNYSKIEWHFFQCNNFHPIGNYLKINSKLNFSLLD